MKNLNSFPAPSCKSDWNLLRKTGSLLILAMFLWPFSGFAQWSNGATGTNHIYLNPTSKTVSIGTYNPPKGKVGIFHNSSATGNNCHLNLYEDQDNDFARIQFSGKNTGGLWHIAALPGGGPSVAKVNFWYSEVGTTGKDIMSLLGNGNVGIGSTAPVYHLQLSQANAVRALGLHNTTTGSEWELSPNGSLNELQLYKNTAFRGRFHAVTGTYTSVSDARLKKDVKPLSDILPALMQLKPVSYGWKDCDIPNFRSIGFIAQDVQKIFPELVNGGDGENDFFTLDYAGFSPVAIQAIQELKLELDEQKTLLEEKDRQIENMETRLARLEALMLHQATTPNTLPLSLSAPAMQTPNKIQTCFPNPVRNTLTIVLENALSTENAQLSLFNADGKEVKKISIGRGETTQELLVSDLPVGVYTLSLLEQGSTPASQQVVIVH